MRHLRDLILLLLLSATAHTTTVNDVPFPDTIAFKETPLVMASNGLLRKFFIDVYAGALYLPDGMAPNQYAQDVPKCIRLHYFYGFRAEQFGPATDDILERTHNASQMAALRTRLDEFNAAYLTVEDGDRYTLCYNPGHGTDLIHNDEETLVTIPGADFAASYFSVWLGEDPVDKKLRKQLCAKTC